ncbi:MAG: SMI1/KNR4 family protein [Chloroflexota bacterium]
MTEYDWQPLLIRWRKELIASPRWGQGLPSEVATSGWLGFPGASEEQLARAETRLGTRLPPSYRAFLRTSNGWRATGTFIDYVYACEELEWFRARHQQWIDAYVSPPLLHFLRPTPRLSDAEYYVYGEEQDSARFRPEYLRTALAISAEGDSAIYLLNPQVVTPEGEWEAWFFANWLPGASRYRSFWEMMQAEHASFLELEKA